MTTPRFLVAKFVPDLRRMEPKNIGVIVWADGNVRAKFAGEQINGHYKINPPGYLHVQSKPGYRKWVEYWRAIISKPTLRDEEGNPVSRSDIRFVDAIRSKSKPQFKLVDGGEFMTSISESELDAVIDELFEELVKVPKPHTATDHGQLSRELNKACRQVLDMSGLQGRDDFWDGFSWPCAVGETVQPFKFDYAIHRGTPVAVMSKIQLFKPDRFYRVAFEFDAMKKSIGIPRENCAALVYPSEHDFENNDAIQMLDMMNDIGRVVDMRYPREASTILASLAAA